MQCLLRAVSAILYHSPQKIIDYLGHDGQGRGYNIFEMTDYILRHTGYKPVIIERDVRDSNGGLLNTELTADYFDLPIPKIVLTAEPVPHAVPMFRDGSVRDFNRSLTDSELEELKNKHYGLMLFYGEP